MSISSIALSGIRASTVHLAASASNVANVNSAGIVPGSDTEGPAAYQPVNAVSGSLLGGGVIARLEPSGAAPRLDHDPSSPLADARGMVAQPDVELSDEAVAMLTAKVAFEANARMLGAVHDLDRHIIATLG